MRIRSPLTVGLFAGKWCSYAAGPDLAHDQREEDGGALVFDSEPLPETLEILGATVVTLEISSDQPLGMVAIRLSDIAVDDKVTRVSYGMLNLTHRDSAEHPAHLVPGERYTVSVSLNGVAHSFPQGHRLRIAALDIILAAGMVASRSGRPDCAYCGKPGGNSRSASPRGRCTLARLRRPRGRAAGTAPSARTGQAQLACSS